MYETFPCDVHNNEKKEENITNKMEIKKKRTKNKEKNLNKTYYISSDL